jgi:hypothetical protein
MTGASGQNTTQEPVTTTGTETNVGGGDIRGGGAPEQSTANQVADAGNRSEETPSQTMIDSGAPDGNTGRNVTQQQRDASKPVQTEKPDQGDLNGVELTELRRFEIGGAEVWARSALKELPETATRIELSATVIDSGNGPEACMGVVLDSRPPQCEGPVVDGLQMQSWAESSSGVTWGERTMIVEWPPLWGRLTLVSDRAFELPPQKEPPAYRLPSECSSFDRLTSVDVLSQWAAAHPDQVGLVYVLSDQQSGVLGVTGDVAAVRAELRADGIEPCVIKVAYSISEMEAAQAALVPLFGSDAFITSTSSGGMNNRVIVGVLVADMSTVRKIVALVNDPGILSIEEGSLILDGE